MSRNKIGGWRRLWLVISVPWVAVVGPVSFGILLSEDAWPLVSQIAAALALTAIPPLVLYVFGWAVGWIVRGFRE